MATTTAATAVATTTDPDPHPDDARPPRSGVSVRVRIMAAVAALAAVALAGAGFVVYAIEIQRLEEQTAREVDQEFAEFAQLADPEQVGRAGAEQFAGLQPLFTTFMTRNVPDDDELLVGWLGDGVVALSPQADPIVEDPAFLDAARPLVTAGGSAHVDTERGEVLISAQPVERGEERGALLVVNYLDRDRAGLRDTMRTYAIVAALSLLLIVAVAFWQAGRLLAPLRTVRETAEEISGTDLSRRLPLRGNDDVTALTRTFNGMLDRLEAAFTGQRQLLDDAGHELRTPLTILQGHLEVLDTDDPRDVAETRELLLDEVDRMRRLVDDLILLAKTERPDFLALGPVDVAALTEAVVAKAAGLGERAWSVDAVADVAVTADQQRITQALLQLAHNAAAHTGPGDEVAVGSVVDGAAVLFWVRDTGPGVAAEDRERIFERFGRGRTALRGDVEGFGLGLSIVTAIARAHGGDAWLDDDYRDGARFVLSVPSTRPAPTAERPPEETRPIAVVPQASSPSVSGEA